MSVGNSVNVNVPLYVRGNLCMSNSANLTGYSLQVGGTLSLSNSSRVGTTDANAASTIPATHRCTRCTSPAAAASARAAPFTSPCGPTQRVYSEMPAGFDPECP